MMILWGQKIHQIIVSLRELPIPWSIGHKVQYSSTCFSNILWSCSQLSPGNSPRLHRLLVTPKLSANYPIRSLSGFAWTGVAFIFLIEETLNRVANLLSDIQTKYKRRRRREGIFKAFTLSGVGGVWSCCCWNNCACLPPARCLLLTPSDGRGTNSCCRSWSAVMLLSASAGNCHVWKSWNVHADEKLIIIMFFAGYAITKNEGFVSGTMS